MGVTTLFPYDLTITGIGGLPTIGGALYDAKVLMLIVTPNIDTIRRMNENNHVNNVFIRTMISRAC